MKINLKDNKFFKAADDLIKQLDQAQKETLQEGADLLQKAAKRKCPVDSGNLKDSIVKIIDDKEAMVTTDVDYAPHVEYGTFKMNSQPFMRSAFDENTAKINDIFKSKLKDIK